MAAIDIQRAGATAILTMNACDLIVAADNANFGLPEVKRGLVAGAGGLVRLPRRLPFHVAMECALTGAMLSAQRAHAYGLVNRLTEPGRALAAVRGEAQAGLDREVSPWITQAHSMASRCWT